MFLSALPHIKHTEASTRSTPQYNARWHTRTCMGVLARSSPVLLYPRSAMHAPYPDNVSSTNEQRSSHDVAFRGSAITAHAPLGAEQM